MLVKTHGQAVASSIMLTFQSRCLSGIIFKTWNSKYEALVY